MRLEKCKNVGENVMKALVVFDHEKYLLLFNYTVVSTLPPCPSFFNCQTTAFIKIFLDLSHQYCIIKTSLMSIFMHLQYWAIGVAITMYCVYQRNYRHDVVNIAYFYSNVATVSQWIKYRDSYAGYSRM